MPSPRPVVLVVEDEPILRMATADMVEAAGFDVVEASDAMEAVHILEHRLDIVVVFTDIDMPRGMDGMRLAAAIRDRWPPIHIIVTSGQFTPDPDTLPFGSLFFSKPYKEKDVTDAMWRMAA